jgi:tripartite-type tricarboxylate transporter receptor subunit TctC
MLKKSVACFIALSFAAFAPVAIAQSGSSAASSGYPNKPLRFLPGFAPGGITDTVARIIAPPLSRRLGQPILIDNRSGAGGVIGADTIAKSAPDGYTLGFGVSGALTANVTLMPNLPYDPLKDLASVTRVVKNPLALLVNSSLGVNSVKEFIALAKAKPAQLSYGTAGAGTAMNLAGELLKQMAGIDMVHVGYKGTNPAAADLLAGHIQAAIIDLATAAPHLKTGRLKALAITSSTRTAIAPELPTMAEAGVPGYEMMSWFGLIMPAGTPPDIVKRINTEMTAVLKDPKVVEQLLVAGADAIPGTPEEMRDTIKAEIQKAAALIKSANIKLN